MHPLSLRSTADVSGPADADAPGVPTAVPRDDRVRPLPAATRATLRSGSRVGRYVVHRALGRGGMGVVYGAVDPDLGRRVALKLVRHDGRTQQRFTARLQREALALARLSHPNIVTLFDIGTTDRGTFVAMEYVRGLDLRRWLRQKPRTVSEILEIFRQAGRGLAVAHEAGLVHRDFKPSNVMVTLTGAAKVLDFGLARGDRSDDPWLTDTDEAILSRRMTRADTIVGTSGYMAPEQLLGADVHPASDQFSFCVALFEALHGARPFPGKTPVEQARCFAVGRRNAVQLRRGVPSHVRDAIERGLCLEVPGRWPNMHALLDALQPRSKAPRRLAILAAATLAATAAVTSAATSWRIHRQYEVGLCVAPPAAAEPYDSQ